MDFAKDQRGNIVRASEAMTGVLGYYYCPVCKAEVFARQGDYYVHHFAHRSRRARPECELYYPSEGIKGPLPPSRYEPDEDREGPRPQLQLSLELEPQANLKVAQLQKWGLRLTVPKSSRSHGQLQIDCGGVHRPKISLAKLYLGPQTYSIADPSAPEFRVVWFSPEVGPFYKESLSEPLPGLARDRINIFLSSQQKLKPLARSLVYGGAYYFVRLQSAAIELPPQITSTVLASNGDWCAALVVLPTEPDAELREWLEAHCHIPASSDGRRWSIIYPPLHGFDPEGRILVRPSKRLFLNISHAEDIDRETSIDFQRGKERVSIQLGRHARSFLEIETSENKEDEVLSLSWNDHGLPSIKRRSLPPAATAVAVRLQLRPHAERGLLVAPLHERAGRNGLDCVRHKQWQLTEIAYPAGIQGTLDWRPSGAAEWSQLEISSQDVVAGANQKVSDKLLSEINARLQDHSFDIHLDFGAYGSYYAPTTAIITAAQSKLSPSLRKQIIWFCKRSKIFFTGDGRALEFLGDRELVGAFEACPSTPFLFGHGRIIRRAIAASMGTP